MISTKPTLTDAGRALLMRAIAGETLTFTRLAIGNGELTEGQDRDELTALISEKLSITPASLDTSQEGLVAITGDFDSEDITEDFVWRELGVYAKGSADNVELLYAYANDGQAAGTLKALTTDILTEQTLTLIVEIDDAENVTAIYSPHAQYAPAATLAGHMNNRSNPHGVTKEQVGLGNVNNTSPENTTVTFTEASTRANIASGEKLSVMFGKIKKVITDTIAHIGNTTNPHSVTKAQVGLGNVSNTSPENTIVAFTEASTRANIASGEKLSVMFGKIKKVITDTIDHIGNTTNPHSVTKSQVGLSNVENYAPSFMPITFEEAAANAVPSSGDTMAQIMAKVAKCLTSLISHLGNTTENPHGVKLSNIAAVGTFTGSGTQKRLVGLDFDPSAVILYNEFGQTYSATKGVCGGLATSSRGIRIPNSSTTNDATIWANNYTALMLTTGGFWVNFYSGATAEDSIDTNELDVVYHYIAFK